jgi:glycosyltransferase involved in cell wall biosynthesis
MIGARKENPVISVVLPVHNGQKYLSQAIESCLNQTFRDFELIIVDDKSTDDSLAIMEEWSKKDYRIIIVRNKENKKLPASLNVGFDHARGEYHTWTSDDNVLEKNFLELMLREIKKNDADIVYSNYLAIGEDGKELEVCQTAKLGEFPLSGGIGASFLYKKKVHELLHGYDTGLFLLEDYDFWVRAYLMGFKFFHIADVLPYKYRRHDASLTETAKNKIIVETIKYRYKLLKKLKLDKKKALLMRIDLLSQGRYILSLNQKLLLIVEILIGKISKFLKS